MVNLNIIEKLDKGLCDAITEEFGEESFTNGPNSKFTTYGIETRFSVSNDTAKASIREYFTNFYQSIPVGTGELAIITKVHLYGTREGELDYFVNKFYRAAVEKPNAQVNFTN